MRYKYLICTVSPIKSKGKVRTLREGSMGIQGALLWNSLPMSLRNYDGPGTSLNRFKEVLGRYLKQVPDKPRDLSGGWMPNPTNNAGIHSNSLVHWRPLLQPINPYFNWVGEGRRESKDSQDQAREPVPFPGCVPESRE